MTSGKLNFTADAPDRREYSKKWSWYWAGIYCSSWYLLFYVAVVPSFFSYPEMLTIRNEDNHRDRFIGERAERQLINYTSIGVKLAGSDANEIHTVNFLQSEVQKIIDESRSDLYDIEVDKQHATGQFFLWNTSMSYDNISNVIVKIAPKSYIGDSYLLINAHFDSEVKSPGTGDDGVMVVIMLETLRVIARSGRPLTHPIVFLFNGAEEANMLASHAFITQHKWAKNCRALINLDSSGSGGREVLFQTGPQHPWLARYYKQSAMHPFASTLAEELFQNGFIPSETDFRVFRDYGSLPGLDMAHVINGYVYHTKFDNFKSMPRGTYQTTGDNVLALAWTLANAPELNQTELHEKGHSVFYDYLGWFMVCYTETVAIAINVVASVIALVLICNELRLISKSKPHDAAFFLNFLWLFLVQLLSIALALSLTLLVAVLMASFGLTQSWYYANWMIFGLYFCTSFFALGVPSALYIKYTKHRSSLNLEETIICLTQAHCLILIFICLVMTGLSIRSAYFAMIAIFFYAASLLLKLIASYFTKAPLYIPIHLTCQLLPFWYYTYISFVFLKVFIPMQGRDGPTSKPDLLIAGFIALISILFAGFILPILHKFRKAMSSFCIFAALTIVFMVIAVTPAGFPFEKEIATQRYYVLHMQRVLHNGDGSVYKNESGYYIQPVETRVSELFDSVLKNAESLEWTQQACNTEPFCGLPLYSGRWIDWKNSARWIHASAPAYPITTELSLISNEQLSVNTKRYNFSLKTADRIIIYVAPYEQVHIVDWSFERTPLLEGHQPPYFLYHVYAKVEHPFKFWLDVAYDETNTNGPHFKLGVGAHFLYHQNQYTSEFKDFLASSPDWTYTTDWQAYYESWIY